MTRLQDAGAVRGWAMKTCPFCAEDIREAAIIFKHCHADSVKGQPTGGGAAIVMPRKELSAGALTRALRTIDR